MNNSTKNGSNSKNNLEESTIRGSQAIAFVLSIILLVVSFWIASSIIMYGVRTKKWKFKTKVTSQKNALVSLCLATAGLLITSLRFMTTVLIVAIGYTYEENEEGNRACEILLDFSITVYAFSIAAIYFFVWYRQKVLYNQPLMSHLKTKTVLFFSHSFVIIFLCFGASSVILFVKPVTYELSKKEGCKILEKAENQHLPNYLVAATLVTSQVILLGLLLNPTIALRSDLPISSLEKTSKSIITKNKRIMRAARAACLCTIVCITSDVLAAFLVSFILTETRSSFRNLVYDFGLIVNVISIVFCFENYKKIFTSLVCTNKKSNLTNSPVSFYITS